MSAKSGQLQLQLGRFRRALGEAGVEQRQRPAPVERLFKLLHDWLPGAAHTAKPQIWKGARPMLSDGPPVIGPSPRPGVWLNVGHGARGWSLACGSARLLADQIAGRTPAIDAAPYSAQHYAVRATSTSSRYAPLN